MRIITCYAGLKDSSPHAAATQLLCIKTLNFEELLDTLCQKNSIKILINNRIHLQSIKQMRFISM